MKPRKIKVTPQNGMSQDKEFNRKLYKFLIDCGIPSTLKGFIYIMEAIKILKFNHELGTALTEISIVSIYDLISDMHNLDSPAQVERCIREAVKQSFAKGDINLLQEVFSYGIDFNTGKVKNSQFLVGVCNYFILDMGGQICG